MEIPIGRPGERAGVHGRSPYGGNLLLAPHELATGLQQTGFDRCTTASNHSNDLGPAGIASTLDAFDSVGISHTGTARTAEESAAPRGVVVGGVAVAHLSFTRYSNTNRPADGWRLDFAGSVHRIATDVREARANGAEVVIVSLHISRELASEPSAADRAFVTDLTAEVPIDLIVEHGPHVIQPVEQVNGAWVFWSVGNFVSGMGQPGATRYGPPTLDGLLAQVHFEEQGGGGFLATPTAVLICNEIVDRTVYPALATLARPAISNALRRQLESCVARARVVVPDLT
jgi:poly-gamma-glutamate synthesis protein (capsule biosynthesis protein)